MRLKHLVSAAATGAAIGLSPLLTSAGAGYAAPADPPPPCVDCQPVPGDGPLDNPAPPRPATPGVEVPGKPEVIPPVGGGPNSGGRSVQLPP